MINTFKGDILILDQNSDWIRKSTVGHGNNGLGKSGREETDLSGWIEFGDDLVDLLDKSEGQHFVGLIDDQHSDGTHIDKSFLKHRLDFTWCSDDHLNLGLKFSSFGHLGSTSGQQGNVGNHHFRNLLGLLEDLIGKLPGMAKD